MDELEKIKIYAQMLLEVVNQAEIKRYQEKKDAANAKEQQMLIDLSGISVNPNREQTDGIKATTRSTAKNITFTERAKAKSKRKSNSF